MKTLTFGEGRPRALITAGVHGDEYEPILAVRRLAKILADMSLQGSVQMVPLVNPGAFARRTRIGDDEKDLARTCPGDPNGSVTERIADEISALVRDADLFIDLHTGGIALQLTPLSGYVMHSDPEILDKQRDMALAFNVPLIWGSSPLLNGRTLSVARDANVPAIYAEWGGGAPVDPRGVEDYVAGCLNVLGLWKIIEREEPESKIEWVVEEDHDTSGELTLAHRAPFDGLFDCQVGLGQIVEEGQLVGVVFEPDGEQEQEIHAELGGMVICLRAVAQVKAGDSLATILELPGE